MRAPAAPLDLAYEHCRLIHAQHGRTYYLATRLLPRARRPHVWALYAFARVADEFVDDLDAPDPDALVAWSQTAMAVLPPPSRRRPTVTRCSRRPGTRCATCGLEPVLFEEFLSSMRMDITVDRYATWEDLRGYMRGSAAVIGEMMAPLLGAAGPDAMRRAGVLGEAFQLTNFIRDVAEDLDRGRIYLPLEDLQRFGVSEDDLRRARVTGQPSPAVRALLDFEVRRALELYEDARPGLAMVDDAEPALPGGGLRALPPDPGRGGGGRAQRVRRPAERAALAAAGHRGPGRAHRRKPRGPQARPGAPAGPASARHASAIVATEARAAAPVSPRGARAQHGAGPHPAGAGQQHQREPEEQVLDRRPDQAAVAEERDPGGAEDGGGVVADDARARSASRC